MIQSNIKHTTRKSIKKWSKLVYEMPCNRSTALKQVLSNCLEPLCYWEDLISCISFLLQHNTLTGDHFPQVPSATEGFIQCEPQFFSWQNTFQIWIPIIFHLKRMLTLRCMETTWPRCWVQRGAAWWTARWSHGGFPQRDQPTLLSQASCTTVMKWGKLFTFWCTRLTFWLMSFLNFL